MLTTRSSTANESFEKKQMSIYGAGCVPLILKRDVDTRWNSLFDLVMRLLRVKECVAPWLNEQGQLERSGPKKAKLKGLIPTDTDWKMLNYFCYILRNFAKYTSFIGSNGDCAINHTFNVYNALFDTIDQARAKLERKEVCRLKQYRLRVSHHELIVVCRGAGQRSSWMLSTEPTTNSPTTMASRGKTVWRPYTRPP